MPFIKVFHVFIPADRRLRASATAEAAPHANTRCHFLSVGYRYQGQDDSHRS